MKVKIKKLSPEAVIPAYSHSTDAALDLTATSINTDSQDYIEYGTGLAMDIPEGFVGLIFPRSSISNKSLLLTNSVGVIDSGYHGEIRFRFKLSNHYRTFSEKYKVGDRIGQIIIVPFPKVEFEEVKELGNSERGDGGFGSSGK